MQVFTWPGKDADMYQDFEGWTPNELQRRGELVQNFDRLCAEIVSAYVNICRNYHITEEQILVPKTIKILEPIDRVLLFYFFTAVAFSGCGFSCGLAIAVFSVQQVTWRQPPDFVSHGKWRLLRIFPNSNICLLLSGILLSALSIGLRFESKA
jgi:hypothetical protein